MRFAGVGARFAVTEAGLTEETANVRCMVPKSRTAKQSECGARVVSDVASSARVQDGLIDEQSCN
jgi:hypothetical protein